MKKFIKMFNSLKLRTKLTILLGIVGLVPILLLGVTLSVNAHNTVMENRKSDMRTSLQQATAAVDSEIAVCEQMMDYFAYDKNVADFIKRAPEQEAERLGYYENVRNTIGALEIQNLLMRQITIYSDSVVTPYGNEARPLEEMKQNAWYEEAMQAKPQGFLWFYNDHDFSMVVVHKMPVYDGIQSYLVVKCNIQSLLKSFENLAVDDYGVHIDGEQEIWNFYDNEKNYYFEENDKEFITMKEEIPELGFEVIYYTPRAEVDQISWQTVINVSLRLLFCVILILILGRVFSNYISKPIEMLRADIRKVDGENMEVGITSTREDEIGGLIKSYNHMMKRIQDLIQENYQARISQKEFEMKALQAQINPHFLYNSLSMINWKAIEAGETEISHITLALSSFYRTTLNKGKTMNTIRNAVENIQSYLAIQLLMHDDDFIVHYQIDEDTYEYYIPVLIFQPFVENALEHGLDIKEYPDHQMWIGISQDEKDVLITIADNGVGMSKEETEHILEYDARGYGVKNVNDRLRLHYGEDYHIVVQSVPGEKTSISLRIPKQEKGD